MHGPAAVAGAAPRGLPDALLRAHAALAEGDGRGRYVHTLTQQCTAQLHRLSHYYYHFFVIIKDSEISLFEIYDLEFFY